MDNQRKRNKTTVYGVTFGVLGFPSSYGHKRMETNLGSNFPVFTSFALFRKRTFGGATEAAIGLYLSAGLTVSIPIPELDTEAIFYIPFSMSVRVRESFVNL